MGDRDPEVARENAPNSLRALYGISKLQNAVMGSPDDELAEIQIASLFVSSPPFPTTELADQPFVVQQPVEMFREPERPNRDHVSLLTRIETILGNPTEYRELLTQQGKLAQSLLDLLQTVCV